LFRPLSLSLFTNERTAFTRKRKGEKKGAAAAAVVVVVVVVVVVPFVL